MVREVDKGNRERKRKIWRRGGHEKGVRKNFRSNQSVVCHAVGRM